MSKNIYKNASAVGGDPETTHDYAVIVAPGVVFYTGGFETMDSLVKFLRRGSVYGTFDQDTPEYWETLIPEFLAIIDLRGNSDTGGAA